MNRSALASLIVAAAAVLATGCGDMIQQSAMDTTAKILIRARIGMQQESDVELARAAIPGSLKTVEGFYVANPKNKNLIGMLAEGYCQYSTGFIQDEWEVAKKEGRFEDAEKLRARASGLFLRCANYGLKLLPKKFGKALLGDIATVEKMVKKTGKSHIKGLFWVALGLGSAINMNRDDVGMIAHLPKARIMLERVIQLDDDYMNGLPHIGLGMMHASRGKALGGEPELAKKHFERAIEITGGRFLLAKVMMAKTYAVVIQDRALFRKLLTEVLTTNPNIWPEQRLANELAHHKARRYLTQEKDWF